MQQGKKQIKVPWRAFCAPKGGDFLQHSSFYCVAQCTQYRHGCLVLCYRNTYYLSKLGDIKTSHGQVLLIMITSALSFDNMSVFFILIQLDWQKSESSLSKETLLQLIFPLLEHKKTCSSDQLGFLFHSRFLNIPISYFPVVDPYTGINTKNHMSWCICYTETAGC